MKCFYYITSKWGTRIYKYKKCAYNYYESHTAAHPGIDVRLYKSDADAIGGRFLLKSALNKEIL